MLVGLNRCRVSAHTSFPVPLSPVINTVALLGAALSSMWVDPLHRERTTEETTKFAAVIISAIGFNQIGKLLMFDGIAGSRTQSFTIKGLGQEINVPCRMASTATSTEAMGRHYHHSTGNMTLIDKGKISMPEMSGSSRSSSTT